MYTPHVHIVEVVAVAITGTDGVVCCCCSETRLDDTAP